MNIIKRNTGFICENCWKTVESWKNVERNHCPFCLYSKHLDLNLPWDRLSKCEWLMEPIKLDFSWKKGNMLVHKCIICDKIMKNKVAEDDNYNLILELSN